MKRIIGTWIGVTIGILIAAWATQVIAAGEAGTKVTADQALQKLIEGNIRYVALQMTSCTQTTKETIETLSKGQNPYAIILSCSDSRVPPEIVFDTTLGELFVVRVAGNIPDPIILGSIEYAAEHLGSPLVMVLGHERCGAVMAAFDAQGAPGGNIGAIVQTIAPAVKKAKQAVKGKTKDELVQTAINNNVGLSAENLTRQSPVIKRLVKEGKLRIVQAMYHLDDGRVLLLDGK
jgi:carbonic anhydrase